MSTIVVPPRECQLETHVDSRKTALSPVLEETTPQIPSIVFTPPVLPQPLSDPAASPFTVPGSTVSRRVDDQETESDRLFSTLAAFSFKPAAGTSSSTTRSRRQTMVSPTTVHIAVMDTTRLEPSNVAPPAKPSLAPAQLPGGTTCDNLRAPYGADDAPNRRTPRAVRNDDLVKREQKDRETAKWVADCQRAQMEDLAGAPFAVAPDSETGRPDESGQGLPETLVDPHPIYSRRASVSHSRPTSICARAPIDAPLPSSVPSSRAPSPSNFASRRTSTVASSENRRASLVSGYLNGSVFSTPTSTPETSPTSLEFPPLDAGSTKGRGFSSNADASRADGSSGSNPNSRANSIRSAATTSSRISSFSRRLSIKSLTGNSRGSNEPDAPNGRSRGMSAPPVPQLDKATLRFAFPIASTTAQAPSGRGAVGERPPDTILPSLAELFPPSRPTPALVVQSDTLSQKVSLPPRPTSTPTSPTSRVTDDKVVVDDAVGLAGSKTKKEKKKHDSVWKAWKKEQEKSRLEEALSKAYEKVPTYGSETRRSLDLRG
ncbi:hypothetical protein JCM10212_000566 [Sporobolomyces blumeae]